MVDDPRNIFVNQRNGYNGANDAPQNPHRQTNANNGFSFGDNVSNFANGQTGNTNNEGGNGQNNAKGRQKGGFGSGNGERNPQNNSQNTNQKMENNADYQQKVAEMKRLAEKYQREGEGQLVKDIVNNVIEQKARGQLTNEQLVTFAKRVRPLLNADQRQRLDALVEQLLKL